MAAFLCRKNQFLNYCHSLAKKCAFPCSIAGQTCIDISIKKYKFLQGGKYEIKGEKVGREKRPRCVSFNRQRQFDCSLHQPGGYFDFCILS